MLVILGTTIRLLLKTLISFSAVNEESHLLALFSLGFCIVIEKQQSTLQKEKYWYEKLFVQCTWKNEISSSLGVRVPQSLGCSSCIQGCVENGALGLTFPRLKNPKFKLYMAEKNPRNKINFLKDNFPPAPIYF